MSCLLDGVVKTLCRSFYSRPVFVAGSGPSGTSALRQALGQHPSIVVPPGEAPLLTYLSACVRPLEFGCEKELFLTSTRSPTSHLHDVLRKLSVESYLGRYFGLSRITRHDSAKTRNRGHKLGRQDFSGRTRLRVIQIPGRQIRPYFFVRHANLVSDGAEVIWQLLRFLQSEENARPIDFINGTVVPPLSENTKQIPRSS